MDDFDRIAEEAWGDEPEDFDELFEEAWEDAKSQGQKLLENVVAEWEEGGPAETHIIYDPATGTPVACNVCGKTDDWVCEGQVFVCEHGIIVTPLGAIRVHDTKPVAKMLKAPEPTGRFRCQRVGLYDEDEHKSQWGRKQ